MVHEILLSLGALAGTSLSETLTSPTDASSCEARPPYIVLRTALQPLLRHIFFIILIPVWHGAYFIGTCMSLTCMALVCTALDLHDALTYTAHVFASSCMALVRCMIFASLVFWNKFPCRIFQRFECRSIHAMLLWCSIWDISIRIFLYVFWIL